MRRILSVLAIAAVIAAMFAIGAGPAFGEASNESNCLAGLNSGAAPGAVGSADRSFATQEGSSFGTLESDLAQSPNFRCFRNGTGGPPGPFQP